MFKLGNFAWLFSIYNRLKAEMVSDKTTSTYFYRFREKFVDINSKYKKIFTILVNDIKNFPLKSKRSIEEYDLISNEKKNSN